MSLLVRPVQHRLTVTLPVLSNRNVFLLKREDRKHISHLNGHVWSQVCVTAGQNVIHQTRLYDVVHWCCHFSIIGLIWKELEIDLEKKREIIDVLRITYYGKFRDSAQHTHTQTLYLSFRWVWGSGRGSEYYLYSVVMDCAADVYVRDCPCTYQSPLFHLTTPLPKLTTSEDVAERKKKGPWILSMTGLRV